MSKFRLSFLLVALVIISACETDSEPNNGGSVQADNKVLVLCEGAFQGNSASVSVYDPSDETLENNAFEAVNGYNPGDVLQSAAVDGETVYLVLNNSAKIEVMDKSSLVADAPINGLISPREMVIVSGAKAYVSNLFSNSVQIVDLTSSSVTGAIDVGGWSEGMVKSGDKVFVSRSNGDKVLIIDTATDAVSDSITVTAGPVNMEVDEDGNIWLATNGNFGQVAPKLHKLDPTTNSVSGTYDIPEPYSYSIKVALNGDGDQVYLLNNDVFTMFIGDSELAADAIVEDVASLYGFGIDPNTGDIYTADAGNFASAGMISRYSMSGMLLDQFEVGIAPNGFVFQE